MNYRHNFHAGSAADVFKHIVLTLVLEAIRQKEAPLCVIDSHAGAGIYKLKRSGEHELGIGLLWSQRRNWPVLANYFALIEKLNNKSGLSCYPGSPLIISEYLRSQDRAVLIELHPQDWETLKLNFKNSKNIAVHHSDAWQTIKSCVPPKENRGLVFIDPSYETPDDYEKIASILAYALRHWRNGIYMVWYPIKERRPIEKLHRKIQAMGSQAYAVELTTLPTDVEQRLNGSGLIIINPPWKLLDTLEQLLPALAACLADAKGKPQVSFIDLRSSGPATGG